MNPAAKHFDPVMGVDVHLILPPMGPPIPIPHPFIGFFLDPADYVPIIGATVYVNGVPRVQAGSGSGVPSIITHIPLGGGWVMPPGNEGEAFMGSSTVLAEDEPFSYLSLPVLSCSSIGMPSPPRAKGSPSKSLSLPTSIVTPIPAGPMVLVGGAPTISLMGMAMKFGMAGLGKMAGGLRRAQKSSKRMKKISDKIHKAADKVMDKLGIPPNIRNKVHRAICSVTGHPVDIATGKVFTEHTDFELPGPIPLEWERVYFSTSNYKGPLGHGWHHSYDLALYRDTEEEMTVVRMADGRLVGFPLLEVGEKHFDRKEKLTLIRNEKDYVLRNQSALFYRFSKLNPQNDIYNLVSIENRNDHKIRFSYNSKGNLIQIIDSAGRYLYVANDERGRIRSISGPHPDKEQQEITLVSYEYDVNGDLIAMRDALKQPFRFAYKNHLLVKETNRNGLNFYFEYDGTDENARCIHTWGDDGIYDHKLTYFPEEQFTIVENSLGHKTYHYYNDEGVVVEVIDAMGSSSRTVYNEFNEVTEEIDELGRITQYTYDDRGNQTTIIQSDDATVLLEFDNEDQLTSATDAVGGEWQWTYDEKSNLIKRIDCLERQTQYRYQNGLLTGVTDPAGNLTQLGYDNQYNLSELITVDKATSRWKYDLLGRCLAVTDPKDNVQRRRFDLLGQMVYVDEPDGNKRLLQYDGEGNILHAKDKQYNVRFSYQGMNRLASRSEAGTTVEFHYDTEDQLIGIKNEHGFAYRFELDPLGNVLKEMGFDELTRIYHRDEAGRVTRVDRPEERWTSYQYDEAGRVTGVKFDDETEENYGYREDGELILAENTHQLVQFERNTLGQVTKEIQGGIEVTSEYDVLGRRSKITSSLGANIEISRNEMGDVNKVAAQQGQSQTYETSYKRDLMGLEIERSLPGGITSKTKRDKLGRPIHHQISGKMNNFMDKRYEWSVNDRLRKIIDTKHGTTTFSHDELGNLASAQYGDGTYELRMPDAVGNLFRTKNQSDRKYGPAGQLLEANGTRYNYDPEGNLVQKFKPDGKTWYYEWNASGMMMKVIRPDSEAVTFAYDALGRRLSKTYKDKTTRWVWDGNMPLHEWIEWETNPKTEQTVDLTHEEHRSKTEELIETAPTNGPPADLTTWIFEPESFAPVAKLKNGEQFSIVSNYLGTPARMFNSQGKQVWGADTSIYGKLRNLQGERTACPFRYPGQYEDVETGLYYNRYRYYDYEVGEYVSQDPIRFAGGIRFFRYVHDPNSWIDPWGLILVYRNIRENQSPTEGLSARKPGRDMSPSGHIMNGSNPNFKGSQFQSTTTDPEVAAKWKQPGQTTVMFDTDDVVPDSAGNKSIVDVSTPGKADAAGLKGRPRSRAINSKEVLVEGFVPSDKIKKVKCG